MLRKLPLKAPAVWAFACVLLYLLVFFLSLQFNDNQLDSWEDLDQFKTCTKLQTVYLERNPIWKDTAYRRKVKLYLPNVTQIDATLCG